MKPSESSPSIERSQKRTKRATWATLSGLISSGAIAVVSLFSAPITINYLGKDLYGIWVLITSFLVWAQLFDFGILNGLTNALAEAFGRDDYESARKYICTSFLVTAIISGLVIFPWVWVTLHIPWQVWIRVDTVEQAHLLGQGICIVGSFFFLTLPLISMQRILHANQRTYFAHLVHFITYLSSLLALIIGIHHGFDLLRLLVMVNVFPLIWYVLCWIILMKKVTWMRLSWKYVNFFALKRVAHSSIPILVLQLINIITSQIIPVLLAKTTTLKEIADFSILWKMYMFAFLMMSNIAMAYNPGIRDAFERGEIDWIKKSLKRLLLSQTCLVILGCTPLLFAGNAIIETWIRMPLEQPFEMLEWLIYICCILFAVLNSTLVNVLVILDKMFLNICLALLSSITLWTGILWGVPKIGLMVVFGIIAFTTFISFFYSLQALKRLIKTRAESLKTLVRTSL